MHKIEVLKKTMLKQHNAITNSKNEFSLVERQIIYLLIAELNKVKDEWKPGKNFSLEIDYKILLELNAEDGSIPEKNYAHIREAAKKLVGRVYEVETDKEPEPEVHIFPLVAKARIKPRSTILLLTLDCETIPYFINLKGNFTNFNQFNALMLPSIYSQRMYEILSQMKDRPERRISIDDLRKILNLDEKSYLYADIKRRILEVAKRHLEQYTEISFTYQEIKEGKKVTKLYFSIKNNAKNSSKKFNIDDYHNIDYRTFSNHLHALKLSPWQIEKILQNIEIEEIKVTLYTIRNNMRKETINNPGGYTWKTFTTKYPQLIQPEAVAV